MRAVLPIGYRRREGISHYGCVVQEEAGPLLMDPESLQACGYDTVTETSLKNERNGKIYRKG